MKKDIEIPVVKDVEIALVKEYNDDFLMDCWYAYLFNNSQKDIEAIMIISQATGIIDGENRVSSLFRHAFPKVTPGSFQKIELLDEGVFVLDNTFMLTYFQEGKLFDKNFTFPAGSIKDEYIQSLTNKEKRGIVVNS